MPLRDLENGDGAGATDTLNWVVICLSGDDVCGSQCPTRQYQRHWLRWRLILESGQLSIRSSCTNMSKKEHGAFAIDREENGGNGGHACKVHYTWESGSGYTTLVVSNPSLGNLNPLTSPICTL